ncbi:hypothetical protein V1508DRAFT_72066 [Lipomyces doorenjongii]|uniref:uncharacterized protein n=1 Tax=Lipomyces doorenjongii TaxID=383834 RepID=UPI0034CFA757
MCLSSTKHNEAPKKPSLSPSICTGVDDDEEDEIQSSPVRGSLERYSDTLQNSNASRSSSSISQRRSSRTTLSTPSDGREVVLLAQQFQDPPSNLPIQRLNPKRAVPQWSTESPDGLVSARSLVLSSTTGEQSTVVEKSAHTSIHSVPDFLGQLRHLETITSDLVSQMSENQKRELDATLLRMLWKTHVAAEPLAPVVTGL